MMLMMMVRVSVCKWVCVCASVWVWAWACVREGREWLWMGCVKNDGENSACAAVGMCAFTSVQRSFFATYLNGFLPPSFVWMLAFANICEWMREREKGSKCDWMEEWEREHLWDSRYVTTWLVYFPSTLCRVSSAKVWESTVAVLWAISML